jgi:crotonobetainyl-CoA:carnitine CoA-transferase CaiB-like acyl-CoA transferase
MRHHDEIDERIAVWTLAREALEVERLLQAAGVPAQHMSRVDEVMQRKDGSVFRLEPGKDRPTLMTGLPFSFVSSPDNAFGPTPRIGEHTDEVLQSWLGLDGNAIGEFRSAGVLS